MEPFKLIASLDKTLLDIDSFPSPLTYDLTVLQSFDCNGVTSKGVVKLKIHVATFKVLLGSVRKLYLLRSISW